MEIQETGEMSKINLQMDNQIVVKEKLNKGDKYFPAQYLKKIYDTCDSTRDKAYIMFHAETGVRVSDIVGQVKKAGTERELGAELNRLDWDNNRIWIYDHKKDKWRWVSFPEKVRAMLKQYLLWRQAAGITDRQLFPFSEKTCNRIIKSWAEKIGFPQSKHVGSHWLRHTFVKLSRQAGRDIKMVQANTGDSIKTLLDWYSNLSQEEISKEIEEKPLV